MFIINASSLRTQPDVQRPLHIHCETTATVCVYLFIETFTMCIINCAGDLVYVCYYAVMLVTVIASCGSYFTKNGILIVIFNRKWYTK